MTAAAADIAEPLGYAEYGQRVRSAVVDSLLIGFAVGALVFGLSVFAARGGPFANLLSTLAYLIYLAGATLYYTVCYAEGGQTIGKLTTRTAVRLDGDEDRSLGYVRAFIRALIPPFFWVLIIPGLLDVLWPMWDRKHQTLHDKIVGSVVVQI
jgi:uncharacterized RDD family membrane protein YckC